VRPTGIISSRQALGNSFIGVVSSAEGWDTMTTPGAVQDSIEKFIDHFRRQVDAINMTKMPEQQARLYPQILFVILLDTLSVAAYPKLAKQNRKRFTNFIDKVRSLVRRY
jgi:hypothetical protein